MFSRLGQIARHLSKPAAQVAKVAPTSSTGSRFLAGTMASSTAEHNFARTIHTAACLIIGDEVLGGKAGFSTIRSLREADADCFA